MSAGLQVTLGQHSQAGRKPVNQDFHGAMVPYGPLLASKGIALALADGISSSAVSQIASAARIGKKITEATPPSQSKPGTAPRLPVVTPIASRGQRCWRRISSRSCASA